MRFCLQFFFQQALCYGAFRQVGLHGLCSFSVEQRYLSVDHNYHKIVFSLTMELLKRLSPFSIRQKAVNCLFSGKILSLLMECPIAKILLLEAMQRMLYTRIQNKRKNMGRRVLRV